jgi:sugar lactone lactonase YvrE
MLSPDFEIINPRMNQCVLGNVFVEKLFSGMRWAEGPVWFGDSRSLIWSDNKMMRWFESGHVEVITGKPNCIRVFDVIDKQNLSGGEIFAEVRPGGADGYDIALFGVCGTTRCIVP